VTTWRLQDGLSGRPGNGPSSPASYSGPFLAGTLISVTGGVKWLEGYWWWVCPSGQSTAPQKFALWNRYGTGSSQSVVPGSVVTSGTLTAGQWNFIPLPSPAPLAPGGLYVPATGWDTTGTTGFPVVNNQFGAAQPYAAGITNGPLTAWSDLGASNLWPGGSSANYGLDQGLFGVGGTDPAAIMPAGGSNSANFLVDVQVTDVPPSGTSYRLWPNMADAGNSSLDTATNFTLGVEFSLSQACTLDAIWFYSPPGVTQLPTECAVYDVTSQAIVTGTDNVSPAWTLPGGGAASAGAGWVYAPMPGAVSLPAGDYKAAVCNGAASPAVWNVQMAGYWSTGFGANGLTSGPITAPGNATAASPGQSTYHAGAAIHWPDTSTGGGHNYWVDVEVTPVTSVPVSESDSGAGIDTASVGAAAATADTGSGADAVTLAAAVTSAESATGSAALTAAASLSFADPGGGADALSLPGSTQAGLYDAGETDDTAFGHRESSAFPDVELFLVSWLQGQFPALRWCTILPASITETTVHVVRISGANRSLRVDRPIVDIDVFAYDHATSVQVALGVQALLKIARNVVTPAGVLQSVNTVNGPRWLPEINPDLFRRSATYELYLHA
jgi:hypothetical protein